MKVQIPFLSTRRVGTLLRLGTVVAFLAGPAAAMDQKEAESVAQMPFSCDSDKDCIIAKDACYRPHAVARNQVVRYDEAVSVVRPNVDCPPVLDGARSWQAVCGPDQSCTIKEAGR